MEELWIPPGEIDKEEMKYMQKKKYEKKDFDLQIGDLRKTRFGIFMLTMIRIDKKETAFVWRSQEEVLKRSKITIPKLS